MTESAHVIIVSSFESVLSQRIFCQYLIDKKRHKSILSIPIVATPKNQLENFIVRKGGKEAYNENERVMEFDLVSFSHGFTISGCKSRGNTRKE